MIGSSSWASLSSQLTGPPMLKSFNRKLQASQEVVYLVISSETSGLSGRLFYLVIITEGITECPNQFGLIAELEEWKELGIALINIHPINSTLKNRVYEYNQPNRTGTCEQEANL